MFSFFVLFLFRDQFILKENKSHLCSRNKDVKAGGDGAEGTKKEQSPFGCSGKQKAVLCFSSALANPSTAGSKTEQQQDFLKVSNQKSSS